MENLTNLYELGAFSKIQACVPLPLGYDTINEVCKAKHFVFFNNEMVYGNLLLVFAFFMIWISWYGMENIDRLINVSRISQEYLFTSLVIINKSSSFLILGYLAWFFIYSYNALFPNLTRNLSLIIGGYLLYMFVKVSYEYIKNKK